MAFRCDFKNYSKMFVFSRFSRIKWVLDDKAIFSCLKRDLLANVNDIAQEHKLKRILYLYDLKIHNQRFLTIPPL